MSASHRDTLILDSHRFDANTRSWDAPILTIEGVKCCELWIDKRLVPPTNYSIQKNHIKLNESYEIGEDTRGELVIEYSPTNMLVRFWLPVIVAILGVLAASAQPLLHEFGLLYVEDMVINTPWGYPLD